MSEVTLLKNELTQNRAVYTITICSAVTLLALSLLTHFNVGGLSGVNSGYNACYFLGSGLILFTLTCLTALYRSRAIEEGPRIYIQGINKVVPIVYKGSVPVPVLTNSEAETLLSNFGPDIDREKTAVVFLTPGESQVRILSYSTKRAGNGLSTYASLVDWCGAKGLSQRSFTQQINYMNTQENDLVLLPKECFKPPYDGDVIQIQGINIPVLTTKQAAQFFKKSNEPDKPNLLLYFEDNSMRNPEEVSVYRYSNTNKKCDAYLYFDVLKAADYDDPEIPLEKQSFRDQIAFLKKKFALLLPNSLFD